MDISVSSCNVSLDTFNKFRDLMTDQNGNPILKPVTSEDLDGYGLLEIPSEDGDNIKMSLSYGRKD